MGPASPVVQAGFGSGMVAPMMIKVGVLGTGAVGGYYGAMLARAGVPVVFVGRPVQAAALRENGLRLQTRSFDERVAVMAAVAAAG